jgi:hypothetical protein
MFGKPTIEQIERPAASESQSSVSLHNRATAGRLEKR